MGMRLLSAQEYSAKLRATIQATGRLGFSGEAVTALNFALGRWAEFTYDDDTDQLYICFLESETPDAFKVRQSGSSYYIATSQLFDALGINYQDETVSYDLVRQPALDDSLVGQVYLLKRRTKRKEKSEEEDSESL